MKKLIALTLAALMALSLAACGGNTENATTTETITCLDDTAAKTSTTETTAEKKTDAEKTTAAKKTAAAKTTAKKATTKKATAKKTASKKSTTTTKKTTKTTESTTEELCGGWYSDVSASEEAAAKKALNKALEGYTGMSFSYVKLEATQVVAGTNYQILCDGTGVYPGATTKRYHVTVYEDLDGNCEITDVEEA